MHIKKNTHLKAHVGLNLTTHTHTHTDTCPVTNEQVRQVKWQQSINVSSPTPVNFELKLTPWRGVNVDRERE